MLLCTDVGGEALRAGCFEDLLDRGGRDVDGGYLPAVLGQPDRVAAGAATQIQSRACLQRFGTLGEERVDAVAPVAQGKVLLLPELLGGIFHLPSMLSGGARLQEKLRIRMMMIMGTTEEDVLVGVGPRLRALRRGRGVTLADLAEETGLTASTLSRLENGKLRPTLEQLLPLARAHGVPLDDLVQAPLTGDPRIHLRPVRRFGLVVVPLTRRPGGIQAYKVIYPPANRSRRIKLQTHEGYEWFYVLNGRIRFLLGDQDLTVGEGEAAEFDTRLPHAITSATNEPAELLTLFGPQGERTHLSAT
jgi:transcriptional regulator with XRE-family HTH domain